jgi:hypothetical protein
MESSKGKINSKWGMNLKAVFLFFSGGGGREGKIFKQKNLIRIGKF